MQTKNGPSACGDALGQMSISPDIQCWPLFPEKVLTWNTKNKVHFVTQFPERIPNLTRNGVGAGIPRGQQT
jgi:hypothetical protein